MNRRQVKQERPLWHLVLAACLALVIGFAAVWYYQQHAQRERYAKSYTHMQEVAVRHGGHSISASVAVLTSKADQAWAQRQRDAMKLAVQRALFELDPQAVRAPGALQAFQDGLQARLNQALGSDKIQQVLLTEFLISEGDY